MVPLVMKLLVVALAADEAPQWRFTLEPLLWVPSVEGEGDADDAGSVDLDTSFGDAFGELAGGFLLAFEAQAPDRSFSLIADGLYVRFEDDDGRTRSTTEVAMLEAGIALPLAHSAFEPTAGLRYVGLSLDLEIGGLDATATQGWIDPWLGARWKAELAPGWQLVARGDVGGFGVGSDFTWQALGGLRVRLGEHWTIDAAYRALSVDFDDDDLSYDALVHGPVLGLAFRW